MSGRDSLCSGGCVQCMLFWCVYCASRESARCEGRRSFAIDVRAELLLRGMRGFWHAAVQADVRQSSLMSPQQHLLTRAARLACPPRKANAEVQFGLA